MGWWTRRNGKASSLLKKRVPGREKPWEQTSLVMQRSGDQRPRRPTRRHSAVVSRSPTSDIHSCSPDTSTSDGGMARSGTILPFQNDSSNGSSRQERALRGCATGIACRQKIGRLRTGSFHTPIAKTNAPATSPVDPGFADVSADGSHQRASPPGRRVGWSPSCRESDAWPRPPVVLGSAGDDLRAIRYTNWAGCGRAAPRGTA